MKEYNGSGLTPLFYSEISSSYMLYDIFKSHKQIAIELIKELFHLQPEEIIVDRECPYHKKGSIDIFIDFSHNGQRNALLIEVKVHDYLSATDGQISTYYKAVDEDGAYAKVYFLYLTQFTQENDFQGIATPKTIDEAIKGKELIKDQFLHITWNQMHTFLAKHNGIMTDEQKLIVSLNRRWISQQCATDLENNKMDVGERGLEDYFPDLKIDIKEYLPFGTEVYENKRRIWRLDIASLEQEQCDAVFNVIKAHSESNAVNKLKQYKTEELTLQAAKDYLTQMAQSIGDWKLISFYANLFLLADKTSFLKLNGTGARGFSIKLEIQGKGEISLCTIYRNKTIDFSLKR